MRNGLLYVALFIAIAVLCYSLIKLIEIAIHDRKEKTKSLIKTLSTKYIELNRLIEEDHVIKDIQETYTINYPLKTKRSLDNADLYEYLICLANNNKKLIQLYKDLSINAINMSHFLQDADLIEDTPEEIIKSSGIRKKKFLEIENNLCSSLLDSIRDDTSIEIELYYESPKQVNTYTKTIHADYHALVIAHSESSRREAAQIAVRQERLKMSAGLRYQVLQRDQFRCQICGATKEDGVKLHVDHILPVSKGGKTELSNLRTLCDRCNLGKSDSYNPYDVN